MEEASRIRKDLTDAIQKDTESFTQYMNALKMPKTTEEEKASRREAMQNGLKEATKVPLAIAESALEIFPIAAAVIEKGNKHAETDGLVAAMLARTAILGALLNVKINMNSIKDEAFAAELALRVAELEDKANAREKEILSGSELSVSFVK